ADAGSPCPGPAYLHRCRVGRPGCGAGLADLSRRQQARQALMSVQTHDEPLVVAALYQFVALPDFHELREPLLATRQEAGVRGTLLLAAEGINGTVAGSRAGIDALRAWLAADGRFDALEYKESPAREQPFRRTLVKLRKEIVTLGVEGVDPTRQVGRYVE